MKLNYVVTLTEGNYNELVGAYDTSSKSKAVEKAKKWADEHSDLSVFVSFRRSSDGQVGFINRDGSINFSGKSWTRKE